jgi:excisionase family DNA binding protein
VESLRLDHVDCATTSGQDRGADVPPGFSSMSGLQETIVLTPAQLAERWQVAKAQVYRLTREGKLPAFEVGRYYRYRLDQIEAYEAFGGQVSDA